jgi:hypothetical protein
VSFKIATLDDVRAVLQSLDEPVFYVTNDPNHGVGLERMPIDYGIICIDDNAITGYLQAGGVSVFSLERELGSKNVIFRNSEQLLRHERTRAFLQTRNRANLLLFKTSAAIEKICQENGWRLLASPSRLGRYFENKLRFQEVLEKLGLPSPPGEVVTLSADLYPALRRRYGPTLVVQFAKGFGGSRTFLVEDEGHFAALAGDNPQKKARVARYVDGLTLTINACVTRRGIVIGDLFYQITGLPQCTTYRLGSCGNDWLYPPLPGTVRGRVFEYTRLIGEHMRERGYRGIFGLDFVAEADSHQVFVIENNARLVASIPLFTKLQIEGGEVPLLALHLLEFLGLNYEIDVEHINEDVQRRKGGAQLILHNLEGVTTRVRGYLQPGVYRWADAEGLIFRRPGYSIEDCREQGEFLVLTVDEGRTVNPNIECARIQARRAMLAPDYQPTAWALNLAGEVYRRLDLKGSVEKGSEAI